MREQIRKRLKEYRGEALGEHWHRCKQNKIES